jgi:hypothetical protein
MADSTVGIRLAVNADDGKKALVDWADTGDAQAKRLVRSYDAAADDMIAADRRRAQAAEKINALMPQTGTQSAYQAGASTNYVGQSARESAAAIKELMEAEEQLTARVAAFKLSIDPALAAQRLFDAEIAEARDLISKGAITLDDYCARLRQVKPAADAVEAGHARMSTSGMILQHVMRSTVDSFSAGLPVTMILGEQLSRLGEAASYAATEDGGGKLGALGKFMGGPWGFAFTAAIGIAGALAPKLFEGADAADVLKEHEQALGQVFDQTTGKINEQSKALLLNASIMAAKDAKTAQDAADKARTAIVFAGQDRYVSAGGAGAAGAPSVRVAADPRVAAAISTFEKTNNADQLSATMAAIGRATPALKALTDGVISEAAAFTTAGRAVEQHNAQVRLTNGQGRPGDQRKALGEFGPEKPDLSLVDAQAKLAAATKDSDKATAQATITRIEAKKAYDNGSITLDQYKAKMIEADKAEASAKTTTDKHAASLARQAESMEVSAKAAIGVADAYLQSSDAGTVAEARRKAATDATRKGIDVDEQARRQLALAAAEQVMNAAKSVASMNDEATARENVVKQVQDGTVAADDMDLALQKENALRPLLAARTRLQGDALVELNKVIDATTAAIDRSSAAATAYALPKMLQDSRDRAIELRAQIGDLAHTPLDAALNAASRAANLEADAKKLPVGSKGRVDFVNTKVDEASAGYELARSKYVDDTLKGQQDSLVLSQRELELAGANDNVRTSELDKLKLQLDIRRRFPDLAQDDVDKLLAGVEAIDAANAKAKLLEDTWSEIRSAGDQFLSDLTNPDGSGLKNLLKDVEQEFIKLAALNPLKNLLLGEKNPTLGGMLGSLLGAGKSLFGASSAALATGITDPGSVANNVDVLGALAPKNASGTEYFSGGQTWLAENGPELVTLPTGSKVTPAPATRRILANDNGGGDVHQHFYLDGAIVDSALYEKMVAIGDNAAMRGAAGGAQLAQANAAKRARYRIPGR